MSNTVTLTFVPTSDREISCIVCGKDQCELEATAYKTTASGNHCRVWIGKHAHCDFRPAASWPAGLPGDEDAEPTATELLRELLVVVDEKDERGEPVIGHDHTEAVNWFLDFADKARSVMGKVKEMNENKKEERFFHISSSEDGDVSVRAYTREEFEKALNQRGGYGEDSYLDSFASEIPDSDPNYWHGKGIIIRGEIVVPKAMEVKTKLVLP